MKLKNGLKCNCVCPECGKPLIAKNGGEIKIHHFAHENNSEGTVCFQTMIHRFAKDIFHEIKEYTIPTRNEKFKITGVHLERKIQDIIPDVVLESENKQIFIEIYVTHALDQEKKNKIIDADILTVEYDLSKIDRNITKEQLRKFFLINQKFAGLM